MSIDEVFALSAKQNLHRSMLIWEPSTAYLSGNSNLPILFKANRALLSVLIAKDDRDRSLGDTGLSSFVYEIL